MEECKRQSGRSGVLKKGRCIHPRQWGDMGSGLAGLPRGGGTCIDVERAREGFSDEERKLPCMEMFIACVEAREPLSVVLKPHCSEAGWVYSA